MVENVMAEMKRYILDKNNGFNVIVNLYIIRYLYSHMKKATCFEIADSERKKSVDFYNNVVGITRQRMSRMLQGARFEMSAEDRKRLSGMFGISENYFERDGKCFQLGRLEITDWECYFNDRYDAGYNVYDYDRIKNRHISKVEETLKGLCSKGALERDYETSTPVYYVYYYFKNGTTYTEESNLRKFLKLLSQLSFSDWEEIEDNVDSLEHYQGLLEKHSHYVKVVAEYKRLKEKK